MKKILSVIILFAFFFSLFLAPMPVQATQLNQPTITPDPSSRWVIDPEVTFIGKNAARAGDFLDWALKNYNWVCVKKVNDRQCDDSNNPIAQYWSLIVIYIVVPLLFVVILATSIVIIITRGKSLTIMKFIPRFIAVVLLIVFSYSILQFLYQFTDLIQGFFLRTVTSNPCPPDCISQKDLLYVGWKYKTFIGLRLLGDAYAESAFISLLLTKITALTYFVMVFLLLVRKIILWFFIIVSPIFPILLLYYPVRNTAKIWIGEFFRWLLYAPLFAIFLNGLVYLWKHQIPLVFVNSNIGNASQIEYPTAVNILLGGPQQTVTPTNSLNLVETFALYVVSLIMLWIVILLPWILLQIFLDYASNFAPGETAVMKTLVNMATTNKQPPGGGGQGPQPSEGTAISLPFSKKFSIPKDLQPGPAGMAKEITFQPTNMSATLTSPANLSSAVSNINSAQVNAQVVSIANVKVPTLRDIAKFDVAINSRDQNKQVEVTRITQQLEKISNPVVVTNTVERSQIKEIHDRLVEHSEKGNNVATSMLKAATHVSKERIQASNSELKNVLSQISNPASTSSSASSSTVVNREKLSKLHDSLVKESKQSNNQLAKSLLSVNEKTSSVEVDKIKDQLKVAAMKGDKLASSVISTVNTASAQTQTLSQFKNIASKIANPATVTNSVEREQFTQLHNALQKESKEKNNALATSLLQVNQNTSATQIEKLKDQLSQVKDNAVLQSVSSTMSKSQSSSQVKSVLQSIANPSATTTKSVTSDKVAKLHETLTKASKEGNELATSILSVNEKTSVQDIEKLQEKLKEAKLKGEPLATEVTSMTQTTGTSALPSVNKVQTVSKADYQAVKDMWKQNYQNLEVPQGMAGTREEWIKDDIASIDETIALLSSNDEEKVKEGMENVSNILPFLMMGGFSQTEIVEYLKAKQEAAQDVSKSLAVEEEDKVSVSATSTHAEKTMSATMETSESSSASSTSSSVSTSSTSSSQSDDEESPLSSLSQTTISTVSNVAGSVNEPVNVTAPQLNTISNELLSLVNVKVPKLQDIARYESRVLKQDQSRTADMQSVQNVLQRIADPQKVQDTTERAQFEKVRETLVQEQQKGNPTAHALLSASMKLEGKSHEQTKSVLSQIANPTLATKEIDKQRFTKLNESLKKASDQGNDLAKSILSTHEATSIEDIQKLREKLKDAKAKGEPVAQSILDTLPDDKFVPDQNMLQAVSDEDFEEVKKLWIENYRTLPVPAEFGGEANARVSWIQSDVKTIEETIALLSNNDLEQQKQGMQKVSEILPMLLLGGFSQSEIIGYLNAKREAGKTVIAELQKDEESKVTVDVAKQAEASTQEATVTAPSSEEKKEGESTT